MRAMTLAEREMQSGERIEWLGQPIAKQIAKKTWPIVLFGIPWTAFAIFWVVTATTMTQGKDGIGAFAIFPLFGLPFVLIGVGMLTAPVWAKKAAANRVYVITDRRALVIQGGRKLRVQSYAPEQLVDLSRVEQPDGSGDISFTSGVVVDVRLGRNRSRISPINGFQAVANVREVETRLQALAARRKT